MRREEEWVFQEFQRADAAVPLGVFDGLTLPLSEVYARVELPERPER